jgi:hypothetical protein
MGLRSYFGLVRDAVMGRVQRAAQVGYEGSQWLVPAKGDPRGDVLLGDPWAPPYRGPGDLDNYGNETSEMRRQYREFARKEPAVVAAVLGKCASAAALDVSVKPSDESSEIDKKAAEFVRFAVGHCPGGWSGLVMKILEPAVVDGFSITEKVLGGVQNNHQWGGYWGLAKAASKDTFHLKLQLDVYRNVTGVVNVIRGLHAYMPDKIILFSHLDLYENPFGRSALRAAYRSCNLIDSAYKLWYVLLSTTAGPFLVAKTKATGAKRSELLAAMETARNGGFIVIPPEDDMEVVNLASASSFDAFETKVNKCREEIFLAIRGAYLPFTEGSGSGSDAHGDTAVNKVASDAIEYLVAESIADTLNRQLVPDLIRPNFGDRCGLPKIGFGGTDWQETKTQLDVAKQVQDLGGDVSKAWIYEVSHVEPPRDDGDVLQKPQQGMGGFGQFPGIGSGPNDTGGGDQGGGQQGGGQPAPGQPAPTQPAQPAANNPADGQPLPFSDAGGSLSTVDAAIVKAIGNRVRTALTRRVA